MRPLREKLQRAALTAMAFGLLSACHSSGTEPTDPPYLASFKAFPPAIAKGQTSILSVYVNGADAVRITPDVGPLTGNNIAVQPQVTTTYTLEAANRAGSVSATATVVVDAPAVLVPPQDTTVVAGSQATFAVTATGESLHYQWRKNGVNITGANDASYLTPATALGDSGARFSVSLSNASGNATSPEATLTVVPQRSAQTYYVDPSGSDANLGSSTQPWKTIQKAADTVLPGDLVLVNPGSYDERVEVRHGGADSHLVILRSAASRTAQVKHGFALYADFVRLEGFDITHDQGGWLQNGIWLAGNHVEIVDNYIHDVPGAGISPSWASEGWNHVFISGNRIYRCSAGLAASGYDWTVEQNDIERLIYTDGDSDYTRVFGRAITFRRNHFHGSSESEIGPSHVDGWQTFSNNGEFATDILIEENVVEDFHQGAMLEGAGLGKITFKNNLFITKDWGGAWGICAGGTPNAEITALNNTFKILYHGMGIRDSRGTGKLVARNNIVYDSESAYWGEEADVQGSNNLLFLATGRTLNPSDYPQDIVNLNPLFVNASGYDFHLQGGSPAVNAGTNLAGQVDRDLDGNARPKGAGWDIGAFEYQGP